MNFVCKNNMFMQEDYPSLVKYMGSKSKIMGFVIEGLNKVYTDGPILDLFSGSASLAGAISNQCPVHSNDIQAYSSILANTYNRSHKADAPPTPEAILTEARHEVKALKKQSAIEIHYSDDITLQRFKTIEDIQRNLIDTNFDSKWHLFTKNYSGTWWNHEQCMWIDGIRSIADKHTNTGHYAVILSALMFAMAYASQGTGHYAQYRNANTPSSLKDILIYRKRLLPDLFKKKYTELLSLIPEKPPTLDHKSTQMDYRHCLHKFDGGTIYADPPYCFVHYSRFYHAMETLVLYDYPELQEKGGKIVKGRYRNDRHQSPFCIQSKVKSAFKDLFEGVQRSSSNLVLSYSDTGMISIDEISEIAEDIFTDRNKKILTTDHKHMTLGRKNDRQRDVKECLILVS